ncbi:MAG: class I SAM-dependent methyltransferase [Methylobacter sp.]
MKEDIIGLLMEEYAVSAEFTEAILTRKNVMEAAENAVDLNQFISLVGESWKYISYAFGTNLRAENSLRRMLSLDTPRQCGTALDIGCGYGGFMHAFGKRGFKAVGIEIDKDLASLAELNLSDAQFENSVHVGDLFNGDVALGLFDLITVNDVIEHLPDPILAFNHLAGMLTPGGILAIYAPNGLSIFNATADPHNRVCGSSVLSNPLAKAYVQATLNSNGYGLGEYFDLATFRDLAKRNSLNFKYLPHDGGERPEKARAYLLQFIERFSRVDLFAACNPILAQDVEANLWHYVEQYAQGAQHATKGRGYCEFNDKYLTRAWTIVCKKGD